MSTKLHRSDLADIKALLQARIDALVRKLAPGEDKACRKGRYWMPVNPARTDNRPGSFWIDTKGVPGAWRDEATGDKGDVIDLISYCALKRWPPDRGASLKWARDWLDYKNVPVAERKGVAEQGKRERERNEKAAAEEAERNARSARAWWLQAWARLPGTVAETYLAGRGVDLSALARPPNALRFAPSLEHKFSGRRFPAIMAAMTGADGAIRAVHRTFLAPDGVGAEHPHTQGKAPVEKPRLVWPQIAGCVVRLARGETGLSPEEAERRGKRDRLIICEGIEDGLSLALACPELRVWAAYSLNNLANVQIPECTAEVIVAADNDWGKRGAEKQLQRAIEALFAQRRPIRVARSHIGKDANDALRGRAA